MHLIEFVLYNLQKKTESMMVFRIMSIFAA